MVLWESLLTKQYCRATADIPALEILNLIGYGILLTQFANFLIAFPVTDFTW